MNEEIWTLQWVIYKNIILMQLSNTISVKWNNFFNYVAFRRRIIIKKILI